MVSRQDLVNCLLSNFQIMTEQMAVNLTNEIAGSDAIPIDDIVKQVEELIIELIYYKGPKLLFIDLGLLDWRRKE